MYLEKPRQSATFNRHRASWSCCPIKKIFVGTLLSFLFILPFSSKAQSDQDVLHLKNGSVIRGELIEYHIDTFKIKISGSNILVFDSSEVQKFEKILAKPKKEPTADTLSPPDTSSTPEPPNKPDKEENEESEDDDGPPYFYKDQPSRFEDKEGESEGSLSSSKKEVDGKHPRGIHYNLGTGFMFLDQGYFIQGAYFHNTWVYTIFPMLSAGIGIGSQLTGKFAPLIPLYLDIRGDLLKTQLTPFYYLDGGYSFTFPSLIPSNTRRRQGGLFMEAGGGLKVFYDNTEPNSIAVGAGYKIQQAKEEEEIRDNQGRVQGFFTKNYIFQSLKIKLMLSF